MAEAPSDVELMKQWRSGNRDAGEQLLGRYFSPLRRFFVGVVENEDLVQVTFVRMLESRDKHTEIDNFRSYLFGIARHVLADSFRAAYQKQGREADTWRDSIADLRGVTASELVADNELAELIYQCLQRLSLESQSLIRLSYWEEFGAEEISKMYELPAATVRTKLYRARQKLRQLIEQEVTDVGGDEAIDGALRMLGGLLARR